MKLHPVHRNPNGHWCRCPWGPYAAEPYVPPRDREVIGTAKKPVEKISMWHEAAKLPSLRSRPDLQTPEAQEFLNALEANFPENDVGAIFPWLVREWKKGRVKPVSFHPGGNWQDHDPFTYIDEQGHQKGLDPADLQALQEWVKYQSKTGNKGVELMQHEIGPSFAEARKWDQGGEIVHKFDDHEDAPDHGTSETDPSGWTIARLRDRRDCRREGRLMNHCLGHSSQRYDQKILNGDSLLYSIRDPDNRPQGTMELTKKKEEYYKCPECGQYTPGETRFNGERDYNHRYETHCDNCDHLLGLSSNTFVSPQTDLNVQKFKVDLSKMGKKPDARMTQVSQLYGHTDKAVSPYVEELANHFLSQHGHDYYNTDSMNVEEEEEEEPEPEFEPWWESEYYVPGPASADDYISHINSDEYRYDNAPHDYERAMQDAGHHGYEGPDLHVDHPDWDEIFQSLIPSSSTSQRQVDPQKIEDLFEAAKNNGGQDHLDELLTRAQDWLADEHDAYLDPYGQNQGKGHFPRPTTPTATPEGNPVFPAFNEPGSHYPTALPHEQYLAKNLLHQLDKRMPYDPQLDVRLNELSQKYHYPLQRQRSQDGPRFHQPITPITEETGPTHVRPSDSWRNRIELPYGRPGVEPQVHVYGEPGWSNQGEQMSIPQDLARVPRNDYDEGAWPWMPKDYNPRGRGNYDWNPDPEWEPDRQEMIPESPGESPAFFNEREPSTQRQRAFPGMEWSDDHGRSGPNYPNQPYDPNAEPHEFGVGAPQGSLFPERWYMDHYDHNGRIRKTTLPPELFPPDRYGILERRPPSRGWEDLYTPGQVPLWDSPESQSPAVAPPRAHENPEGQMFDQVNVHGDSNAVFARGQSGNNYRITDWAGWPQAQREWDMHDRRHVPASWDGTPGSVVHGPNGPDQVQFYGVRSHDWPDWANAQVGRVVHPQEVGSQINTQDPMQAPGGPRVEPQHRPWGLWQASNKSSGEWTEVEDKGGKERPKHDPDHGYGVHGVPVHEGKPHLHGRIIEHTHPDYRKSDLFHWRRPVVYDRAEDRLYVGQPGMEHDEMMNHFQKPKPWGKDSMASGPSMPGFIDMTANVGEGGLHFFKDIDIPNVDELHDWVEQQHGVRADTGNPENADDVDVWDDDDAHESSYHPTQNDEWAADDEPVFSATLPEGRWKV